MPDWHVIAENIVRDADHYIGYYSALQIHNLITQPSLKEQIVVSKQMRPSVIKIKSEANPYLKKYIMYYINRKWNPEAKLRTCISARELINKVKKMSPGHSIKLALTNV